MPINQSEIERRTEVARAAIRSVYGTEDDEFGATLFVSHHLEELEPSYWEKYCKTASPEPSAILEALVLATEFDDEEDLDMFDFTLPGEVTDYLICVRFDDNGEVEEITMES